MCDMLMVVRSDKLTEKGTALERLLISDAEVESDVERLAEEGRNYFRIDSSTGSVVFSDDGLNDRLRIGIILTGRYFAWKLKKADSPGLSISDIAKAIGRKVTSLSGPAATLVEDGIVTSTDHKYTIVFQRIPEFYKELKVRTTGKPVAG